MINRNFATKIKIFAFIISIFIATSGFAQEEGDDETMEFEDPGAKKGFFQRFKKNKKAEQEPAQFEPNTDFDVGTDDEESFEFEDPGEKKGFFQKLRRNKAEEEDPMFEPNSGGKKDNPLFGLGLKKKRGKRKKKNDPLQQKEKKGWVEGEEYNDDDIEYTDKIIEKYKLTDDELQVKSMWEGGEPLNRKGRKTLKKVHKKQTKLKKKLKKYHRKKNLNMQSKEVKKRMKKNRRKANKRMRR